VPRARMTKNIGVARRFPFSRMNILMPWYCEVDLNRRSMSSMKRFSSKSSDSASPCVASLTAV